MGLKTLEGGGVVPVGAQGGPQSGWVACTSLSIRLAESVSQLQNRRLTCRLCCNLSGAHGTFLTQEVALPIAHQAGPVSGWTCVLQLAGCLLRVRLCVSNSWGTDTHLYGHCWWNLPRPF